VREGGRIVSVAAIIAVAVNTEGKREIVGLHIGPSRLRCSGPISSRTSHGGADWREAGDLRRPRGPQGGDHRVLSATWQRCRVHFMRAMWPTCPRARTLLLPPPSARSSSSPITLPQHRSGARSPTSCAPLAEARRLHGRRRA
jgi:hypothetical protein